MPLRTHYTCSNTVWICALMVPLHAWQFLLWPQARLYILFQVEGTLPALLGEKSAYTRTLLHSELVASASCARVRAVMTRTTAAKASACLLPSNCCQNQSFATVAL